MRLAGIAVGLLGCGILLLGQQRALMPAPSGELAGAVGGACYICVYDRDKCRHPNRCDPVPMGYVLEIWSRQPYAACWDAPTHVSGRVECVQSTLMMCYESYLCSDASCTDCTLTNRGVVPTDCHFSGEACVGE
jgi:hypothetical protein